MAEYFDIFGDYLSRYDGFDAKVADVAAKTEQKKVEAQQATFNAAAGMNTGVGGASATGVEADLRNFDPISFQMKYGDKAPGLMAQASAASRRVQNIQAEPRRVDQVIGDTVNSVVGGAVNTLGGISALGAGLVSARAGKDISQGLEDFNVRTQGFQSNELNRSRELDQAISSQTNRDSEKQYREDTGSLAGLHRIAREAISAVTRTTDNPTMIADVTANAAGSLLTAAPIAKGLSAIGKAIMGGGMKVGALAPGSTLAPKVMDLAGKAAIPASIGLQEAGGTYQQTIQDAYNELADRTDLTEEQKLSMASDAALTAAGAQGAVGALTGTIVSKFEGNPLAHTGFRSAVGNVLKEGLEEGIQSGSSQLAQNMSIAEFVNPNRDITEGVGEQIGQGIIGGLGSAGAVQSPNLAVNAALETAKLPITGTVAVARAAGNAIMNTLTARGRGVAEQLRQEGEQYINPETAPVDPVAATPTRFDTLLSLGSSMAEKGKAGIDRLLAARQAVDLAPQAELEQLNQIETERALTPDETGVKSALTSVVDRTKDLFSKAAAKITSKQITTENVATPETQRDVDLAIGLALTNPDKVSPEQNDSILFHADQGRINLTPEQRNALRVSSALVRTNIDYNEKRAAIQLPKANIVSREIQSERNGPEETKKSLKSHMEGISAAYSSGDTEVAAKRLGDLRLFAQHMSNKVVALNEALSNGKADTSDGVRYSALLGNGRFRPSAIKLAVNPYAPGSVRFAQQVALDAEAVASVTNTLAGIFPDLGVEHIDTVPLDASLQGPADEVVANYRSGRAKVPVERTKPNIDQTQNQEKETVAEQDVVSEEPVLDEQTQAVEPEGVSTDSADETVDQVQDTTPVEAEALTKDDVAPEVNPQLPVEAFPDLRGSDTNIVRKGFRLPAEPKTRTIGDEAPFKTVRDALSSATTLRAFIGSDLNRSYSDETAADYAEYLKLGSQMGKVMNTRLAAFLKKNAKGFQLHWREALAANITNEDGTYNPELQQVAVLAGLNWFLKLDTFASHIDAKAASAILGYEVSESDPLVDRLNLGLGATELSRSLAQEIKKFWGLDIDQSLPVNQTEGVLEAVAKEVIESMVTLKAFDLDEIEVGEGDSKRTVDRYRPTEAFYPRDETGKRLEKTSALFAFPQAIETAIVLEPEQVNYIGEAPTKVAQTQLRNPAVRLTEQQKSAIAEEHKVPHTLDMNMLNFVTKLGEEATMVLFGGGGDTSERVLNKNHKSSLDGQNMTAQSAYRTIEKLVAEMQSVADLKGLELNEVPVHYDYNFTSVNRMQMLGKDNPQSNKLMREVILPTWKTVDLTDISQLERFYMGLAQAMGVKVHNLSREESLIKLNAELAKFPITLEILSNHLGGLDITPDQIKSMSNEGDLTPAMVHAMMEYVRSNSEDKKAFRTATYFEADGVANGVSNAMMLFPAADFSSEWLHNIRKGGYYPGQPNRSMNEHRAEDTVDLYEAAASKTQKAARELLTKYIKDDQVSRQIRSVNSLMNMFLSGVSVEDDNLVISRNATKNPLTITLYGSGAAGIAGNIRDELVNNIYEAMSQAAQRKAENPKLTDAQAMFGPDPVAAEALYTEFTKTIDNLTGGYLFENRGAVGFKPDNNSSNRGSFADYTFSKKDMKNMQDNILHAFIGPMREGIKQTVGADLMESTQLIQKQIQSWSLFGMYAYQKAYAELKNSDKYAKSDLLSPADEQKVMKKIKPMLPFISTPNQNFLMGGTQSVDLGQDFEFGRSFTGSLRTNAFIYGPSDAGVSGIPFMTIGAGDGQMMLYLSNNPNTPFGRITIFDGVHSSADEMDAMGTVANQSAFQAWENNPLGSVTEAFAQFIDQLEPMGLTEDELKPLIRTLFDKDMWDTEITEEQVITQMKAMSEQGLEMGRIAAARHKVISQVNASIDQMAGAGAPYQHNGGVDLSGLGDEQIIGAMNMMLMRELTPEPVKEETPAPVVVPSLSLEKMVDKLKADRLTKSLLRDVVRSMAINNWKVVSGLSNDEMYQLLIDRGLSSQEALKRSEAEGFTLPNEHTIYMKDANPETILHELIHAATFDKVLAHYQGNTNEAVTRLEGLMDEFKKLDVSDRGYLDALDEMEYRAGRLDDSEAVRKAAELNEFMAWALSNADLQNQLKQTKVENKLLRIARAVVREIKAILWGGKRSAAVKDDLFSNIRFNTNILMRSQASNVELVSSQALFHNPSYGQDDRLTELNRQIQSRIGEYVKDDFTSKDRAVADRKVLLTRAARIANRMSAGGFPMNAQEQFTFINLVAILGTDVELNTNAAARLQELYRHTVKNLSVESFMENPESDDPNDRYLATEQFNSVIGKFIGSGDTRGRSFLLPSFLALAMVNNDFRQVLSKVELPKGDYAPWKSVDNILDNLGSGMMANVSRLMSGEGKAKNVQAAMDALTDSLLETAEDRELYIEKFTNPIGDSIDRMNDIMRDGMTVLSKTVVEKSRAVKADTDSYVVKGLANAAEMVAAVISEESGQLVSEGVISGANRTGMWKGFHDLLNDLVGRTESNASIYDMIKVARSWGQQIRQQFREKLPQILAKQFSRELTDAEWSVMHKGLGQTDIAALRSGYTMTQIMDILGSESLLDQNIEKLEMQLGELQPKYGSLMRDKAIQLANYMITKEVGSNLLRNSEAIARLLGEGVQVDPSSETVQVVDQLTTLFALKNIPETERNLLSSLVQSERQGVTFVTSYLQGQRTDELNNSTGNAKFNNYKGYIPSDNASKGSLVIVDADQVSRMLEKSYMILGYYTGSERDVSKPNKVYMFAPVSGRAGFNQGIMQNVQLTANGVHADTGFSMEMNAGQIIAPELVERIRRNQVNETGSEALIPLYNKDGKLYAYERSIDPKMMMHLKKETHIGKMIGAWAGRQIEEAKSFELNKVLIDRLRDMYDADRKLGRDIEYVNVFKSDDKILRDAASLITDQARLYINEKFPKGFMVRKDMLNDSIGYRSASIGDVWTGNSRWSETTQENVKHMLMGVFGRKAYQYTVNAEKTLQNFITDARITIVIRSVVVPMANMAANVLQLISRGVPALSVFKGIPQKTAEIDSYVKSRHRQIEAEAELRANLDPLMERKLKSEIRSITDAHKRMSIWPLIEAGEFSAISDAGSREDVLLGEGRLSEYVEGLVDRLPAGIRTAGKYAMISRDTALFRGLQKAIEYGDFIAKAVLYDDLTKRQKLNQEKALARITEEFVNYDRLPGRFRGYMESVGLLWFWNFKIRSAKVAMSMIRNNPVHASLAMLMPLPSVVGNIGLPIDDNFWAAMFDGRLGNSVGFDQALRAPGLLPINNIW